MCIVEAFVVNPVARVHSETSVAAIEVAQAAAIYMLVGVDDEVAHITRNLVGLLWKPVRQIVILGAFQRVQVLRWIRKFEFDGFVLCFPRSSSSCGSGMLGEVGLIFFVIVIANVNLFFFDGRVSFRPCSLGLVTMVDIVVPNDFFPSRSKSEHEKISRREFIASCFPALHRSDRIVDVDDHVHSDAFD